MAERWKEYVIRGVRDGGGPIPFGLAQWAYLFPVFLAIRRALPQGGRVLDVGCGAGIFAALLGHHGYDVTTVDEDADIVAFAQEMARYFRSPAQVQQATAFDLSAYHGRFDLVYSLGVVEHFDADVTVGLIKEQTRCGPVVVVVVPTRHARHAAPVTDERLYSRREVSRLVRRAGCRVRESFVFGDVPTVLGRNCGRFLPRAAYRAMQDVLGYGMDICCVGRSS